MNGTAPFLALARPPYSGIMPPMKTSWDYKDIIDFEYFCYRDLDAQETDLHQRDRNIFLSWQDKLVDQGASSRGAWLALWLASRIKTEFSAPGKKTPGSIYSDTLRLAKSMAIIAGLIFGLVSGSTFFAYTGVLPINVFHFLLFFVLAQLCLAGLALFACLLRLLLPRFTPPSLYSLLLHGVLHRLARVVHRHVLQSQDNEIYAAYSHALNIFRTRSTIYGSLFYWPLLGLVQLFAIFCNMGLLAATMTKIATSDLAFGWQSTLQISSEMLHRALQVASLPWSWLLPAGLSTPSLAEIEGSRIILKDGIHGLATADLIAWWPFLILCLLFYGLFLRIAFTALARILEERALGKLAFDNAACLSIIRRMRTPLVSTQAAPEPLQTENATLESKPDGRIKSPKGHLLPQVMLIPDDIFGLCPTEKLIPLMQDRGFAVKSVQRFMTGYDEDEEIKFALTEQCRNPEDGLFILMEGWMPPLVSFISYTKDLREILPEKTMIHIGLVGRPVRSGFTPLAPGDLAIWRKKMSPSRDPYLHVFSLLS